jgi:hypothetical protein
MHCNCLSLLLILANLGELSNQGQEEGDLAECVVKGLVLLVLLMRRVSAILEIDRYGIFFAQL